MFGRVGDEEPGWGFEYDEVLGRREVSQDEWDFDEAATLVNILLSRAEWVESHFRVRPVLLDEDDEIVLEAAVNGRADIITFNKRDFVQAAQFGVGVFTPGEVIEILRDKGLIDAKD